MRSHRPIRIGTRGSRLARWQTDWIRARLAAIGHTTEVVEIASSGDHAPTIPLSRVRDPHFFTGTLDRALVAGEIDAAVHSLKDVATTPASGVVIAAVSERADPADALVGRGSTSLGALPPGARIGTCSLRRRAQLLRARPDLSVVDLRGNVDGRVATLDKDPALDAILLAVAGLARLDLHHRIGERLTPETMVPAPGQGALAVSVSAEQPAIAAVIRSAVQHDATALATTAERTVLAELDSGCHLPVAALAWSDAGDSARLRLLGRVLSLDGRRMVERSRAVRVRTTDDAVALGRALAADLRASGADAILEDARRELAPLGSG